MSATNSRGIQYAQYDADAGDLVDPIARLATESSGTLAFTGARAFNGTFWAQRHGDNTWTLHVSGAGLGNATAGATFVADLPQMLNPGATVEQVIVVHDNGADVFGNVLVAPGAPPTITVGVGPTGAAFTNAQPAGWLNRFSVALRV